MRKGKKPQKNTQPGKRKGPVENKDSGSQEEFERQTQEDAELVPPARRHLRLSGQGLHHCRLAPRARHAPRRSRTVGRPCSVCCRVFGLPWERCLTWRMLLSTPSRRACRVGPECAAGLTSGRHHVKGR